MPTPTDNLDALIAEALELDGKATPAPWKSWGMQSRYDPVGDSNVETSVLVATTYYQNEDGRPRTNDLNLINRYRTLAPTLARALRDALTEIARKDAALEKVRPYVADRIGDIDYTCGPGSDEAKDARDALAAIDAALGKAPAGGSGGQE